LQRLHALVATDAERDRAIRTAIAGRRLIGFAYHGLARVAEPHDYGVRKGALQVLIRPVLRDGQPCAAGDWRTVLLAGMDGLQPLPTDFPGGAPTASRPQVQWDLLILRVAPARRRRS
jgi:hypothetical protein